MAFTKIVSPGIDTTGSYTVQELNTVGVMTAGTVQVGAATTVHTTGIDLGSGNITSHNINSTGIITATSFVGSLTAPLGSVIATDGTFSTNLLALTKIGIGTDDPDSGKSLHVFGDTNDTNVKIEATAAGKDARLELIANSTGVSQIRLGDEASANPGSITYNHIHNSLSFRTNGTSDRLNIISNGKVGIGSTQPGQLLTVGGITGGADGNLSVKTNSSNHAIAIEENDGNENYQLGVNSSGDLGFYNSGATVAAVTFDDSGRVGIGSTQQTAQLEVATSVDGEATLATFKNTSGGGTNETVDIKLGLENNIASNVILRAGKKGNHSSGSATDNFFAIHTTVDNTSSEKLRITGIGSVGIGVDDPYYLLDVRFDDDTLELSTGQSGNWGGQGLRLQNDNTTVGSMSLMHFRSGNNADWHVGTRYYGTANSDFVMIEEGVERLVLSNEGRIGLGTDDPQARIHIYHDGDQTNNYQREIRIDGRDSTSATAWTALRMLNGGGHNSGKYLIGYPTNHTYQPGEIAIKNYDGPITFYNGNNSVAERLRITPGGNVAIGMTATPARLNVVGDEGIFILSSNNSIDAKIRFSSHRSWGGENYVDDPFNNGTFQFGTLSYNHSDAESGDYYNGNTYHENFTIKGNETTLKFQVQGDIWSTTESGTSGRFAVIDGQGRFGRGVTTGLYYHPDGTRVVNSSENGYYSYVTDTNHYTYIAARKDNDWSAVMHCEFNNVPRHSMHAQGHASHYRNLYIGRSFVSGTGSTPSSHYYSGGGAVTCYATASNDRTVIYGRSSANTDPVFLSEVNGEDNIRFTAAGNGYWDGVGDSGAADYAEYFEWADGNPNNEDRVGKTVVIVPNTNGKIGIASTTDDASLIIGVVSGRPAIVGDSASLGWHGRYRTDEFGRRIMDSIEIYTYEDVDGEINSVRRDRLEEGFEIPDDWTLTTTDVYSLSDDYDSSMPYTPREERQEWSAIGMLGKLTIYKNQIKGDRWIKLKDINDQLEQWLVR